MESSQFDREGLKVLIHEVVSGGGMVGDPLPVSWAAEGVAIRRAIVADLAAVAGVHIVETVDARCLDAQLQSPKITRIITDQAKPIDLRGLAKLADAVILIAPELDGELLRLAHLIQSVGGRSLGCSPEAIALCSNKARLGRHFEEVGIPTPPSSTFVPESGLLPRISSPSGRVVVKPVDGAGAIATFVLAESSPCPPELVGRATALIQPFRPGRSLSASFLVGSGGRAQLLTIGSQRVEVGAQGEVRYLGGEVPVPCCEDHSILVRRAVESVPGLLGFVGVDFLETDEGPEILEINPRLTTSIVGLIRLAPLGTIGRGWLSLTMPERFPEPVDLDAIRTARSVRFNADGSILRAEEVTR